MVFVKVCARCGRRLEGLSLGQVEFMLKQHRMGKACKADAVPKKKRGVK